MRYLTLIFLLHCLIGCTKDSGSAVDIPKNVCEMIQGTTTTKIMNGQQCLRSSQSPLARIVSLVGSSSSCAGVMITLRDVLTTANCSDFAGKKGFVYVGGETVAIASSIRHPNVTRRSVRYGNITLNGVVNDVAILRLSRPVRSTVLPIIVSQDVRGGDTFGFFGFGKTSTLVRSGTLEPLSGTARVMTVDDNWILSKIDAGETSGCDGDTGGPLISSVDGQYGVVGLFSGSTDVASGCPITDPHYDSFTNLQSPSVINFIQDFVPSLMTK